MLLFFFVYVLIIFNFFSNITADNVIAIITYISAGDSFENIARPQQLSDPCIKGQPCGNISSP